MSARRPDKLDRRILEQLWLNGRITNVDLAASVNLSPPPCLRRVRWLEEHGFVGGYHAVSDAKNLGYSLRVIIRVSVDLGVPSARSQINAWAKGKENIREVTWTFDSREAFIRLFADDDESLANIVGKLTSIQGVSYVIPHIVSKATIARHGLI